MENTKKNKDGKGIALISIGILTVIAAIAGASFAYFQVTATSNFNGNSAYVANSLNLTITHSTNSSVGTKKLIPQKDEKIQTAVTGTSSKSCIDANGNAVCKVYTITVKNETTSKYYLDGTLSFTTSPATTSTTTGMPNLKWAKGTSATAGFPSATTGPFYSTTNYYAVTTGTSKTTVLADGLALAGGASQSYYVVVWISETGAAQTDNGSFVGTVTFNGFSNSGASITGVTSTIR